MKISDLLKKITRRQWLLAVIVIALAIGLSVAVWRLTRPSSIAELEQAGDLPVLDRGADLRGPDVDGNGVRDDVDRYIANQAMKEGWTELQVRAVLQAARSVQSMIEFEKNPGSARSAAKVAAKDIDAAIDCQFARFGKDAARVYTQTRSVLINTRERILAYDRFNAAMDGSVISGNLKEAGCAP